MSLTRIRYVNILEHEVQAYIGLKSDFKDCMNQITVWHHYVIDAC